MKMCFKCTIQVEKVRKRWKNLRDMFRNEIKKILVDAGDSLPEEFLSPWTHFDDMIFLKDQIVTRKTLRNLNITGVELNDSDDNEELVEISVSPVNFDDEDEETGNYESSETSVKVEVPHNLSEMIPTDYQRLDHFLKPQSNPRKRKREPDVYQQTQNGFYHHPSLQVDDDYHFLVSFLPSMRQMPFQTKMWFRLKMQELLYNCTSVGVDAASALSATSAASTSDLGSVRQTKENGK